MTSSYKLKIREKEWEFCRFLAGSQMVLPPPDRMREGSSPGARSLQPSADRWIFGSSTQWVSKCGLGPAAPAAGGLVRNASLRPHPRPADQPPGSGPSCQFSQALQMALTLKLRFANHCWSGVEATVSHACKKIGFDCHPDMKQNLMTLQIWKHFSNTRFKKKISASHPKRWYFYSLKYISNISYFSWNHVTTV